MTILKKDFYNHSDVVTIAKSLLMKVLCTKVNGEICKALIVETEAYRGPDDKACHAFNFRRSPKNENMYGPAGTSYVYTCYGMYDLFNVVTSKKDDPHAILIRAVEPIEGQSIMKNRRPVKRPFDATNGPGKLGMAMGISKTMSGYDLQGSHSIWIEDAGVQLTADDIYEGPRVGLSTAEECSNWPWRFYIKGSPWVSRPKHVEYKSWPL
jgi:DNA-3-methyladenine glycosylase